MNNRSFSSLGFLCAVWLLQTGCKNLPDDLRPSHARVGRTIMIGNNSPDELLVSEQYTDHLVCLSIEPGETCTITQPWYDLSQIEITLIDVRTNAKKVIRVIEENQRIDFSPIAQSYPIGLIDLSGNSASPK